jgi:guanylate kinase
LQLQSEVSENMENKKVIIFSAPSGAGKSTIVGHLLEKFPYLEFSISATSRAPRGAEQNGKEYYFISADEFRRRIAAGELVEYQEVYPGSFYGTLKSEVERIWAKGHIILFDIDVKGGVNLKKLYGAQAMAVFVQPPSLKVLEERLRNRGTDSESAIETRIAKAREELTYAPHFDKVIVNDKLEDSFVQAEKIVTDFYNASI